MVSRVQCGFGGDWQGSLITCSLSLSSPSSDVELNCSSEASSTEPCEERPQQPDPLSPLEPLSRHSSLREPLSRVASAQRPEEPRALHGEQRACLPRDRLAGSWDRGKEQTPQPVLPMEDPETGDTTCRLRGSGAETLGDLGGPAGDPGPSPSSWKSPIGRCRGPAVFVCHRQPEIGSLMLSCLE